MGEALAEPTIRPYCPADRPAIRRIYADTAFFGEPVEAYFDDRNLFADLGIEVYLRAFAEHALVAEQAGEVMGYVLGSPKGDGDVHRRMLAHVPGVVGRALRGRYRLGRKTVAYFVDNAWAGLRGGLLEIRDPRYPANLHINLSRGYRGRGLGSRLLGAYLEHLRALGVAGVHAVTTDRNPGAARLFEKAGFRLLERRATPVWRRRIDGEVALLGYGLQFE